MTSLREVRIEDSPRDYVDAVRHLQDLLGVEPDGIIGPKTRHAANAQGFINRIILPALQRIEQKVDDMTKAMDDYKVQWTAFVAKLDAWIAAANANQTNSDKLVADAVAKEQAGQDVSVAELSASLAAEAAKVPDVPATPPAPPVA